MIQAHTGVTVGRKIRLNIAVCGADFGGYPGETARRQTAEKPDIFQARRGSEEARAATVVRGKSEPPHRKNPATNRGKFTAVSSAD